MTRTILLAIMLIALAHAAGAQSVTLAQSGIWTAQAYRTADEAVCSVGAQVGNGTLFVTADSRNPSSIIVSVTPTDFHLPDGPVRATMVFPGGNTQYLSGTGRNGQAVFSLGQTLLAPWLHEFTARSSGTIYFDRQPPLVFDLTGTTPTITAMSDCTKAYGFTTLPKPFLPMAPGEVLATNGLTPPPVYAAPVAPAPVPQTSPPITTVQSPASTSTDSSGMIIWAIAILVGALCLYFCPIWSAPDVTSRPEQRSFSSTFFRLDGARVVVLHAMGRHRCDQGPGRVLPQAAAGMKSPALRL